jgi:cytidylate kinase
MMQKKEPVITIDGASGTGKGTISQILAKRLGWKFLDSGALYRVLALASQKHGITLDNEKALETEAQHLDVHFVAEESTASRVFLDGIDVTDAIRAENISNLASQIAVFPAVRTALLNRQRAFRSAPGLIADGRDMGTVIFPDAELKIFLLASPEEWALRRYNQLKQRGINVTLGDLIKELRERDKRDQERLVAPLKPAEDAIRIDTDRLNIDQVVERILSEIRQKKAFPAISFQAAASAQVAIAE